MTETPNCPIRNNAPHCFLTMADFHQLPSLNDTEPEWSELNEIAEMRSRQSSTAPLPSLDHLRMADFENVYEPAADTFLLVDALLFELDQNNLRGSSAENPLIAMEIGCGTGVPIIYFHSEWNKRVRASVQSMSTLISIATDINPEALDVARQTANANGVGNSSGDILELIQCDLASALLPRLAGRVHVIIFNPPYVPTSDEEVGNSIGIEASWAGGLNGRRVIDRAIDQIVQLLEWPSGTAYMITVDDNRPAELARIFRDKGMEMKPLLRRRAINEFLSVQKITWI